MEVLEAEEGKACPVSCSTAGLIHLQRSAINKEFPAAGTIPAPVSHSWSCVLALQPPARVPGLVQSRDPAEGSGPSTGLGLGTLSTSAEPFPGFVSPLDPPGSLWIPGELLPGRDAGR